MQPSDSKNNNTRANFLIQIQYRHNSSWQGRIVWLDNKKTVVFRSFMELAMLMVEALGEEAAAAEQRVRWEPQKDVL